MSKPESKQPPKMKFVSAVVTDKELEEAAAFPEARNPSDVARLLADQVRGELGNTVDLCVVFLSSHYAGRAQAIADSLRRSLNIGTLIGCSSDGVITSQHEIETEPAVSIVAARLPNVRCSPFALHISSVDNWNEMMDSTESFRAALGVPNLPKLFLLLADPFSTPVESLLEAFNAYYSGAPVLGGMASSGRYAGANALMLNEKTPNFGVVGVALEGDLDVDIVVSQGCRPIGGPYKVTGSNENMIFSLNGGSPLKQVQAMIHDLPKPDHDLLSNGLYIGRAVRTLASDNREDALGRGDFLVRGVTGADQTSGALAIGDRLSDGELVQFHLRDAKTAEEDLELLLAPQAFNEPPAGALLFTCNGRGTGLFHKPDGDVTTIQNAIAGDTCIPLTGFFCGGEFGPIGARNFLHGHTASLVLFRPAA